MDMAVDNRYLAFAVEILMRRRPVRFDTVAVDDFEFVVDPKAGCRVASQILDAMIVKNGRDKAH